MIPRFKPHLSRHELLATFRPRADAVVRFEQAFAKTFEARWALAFPYGRSALWAFFEALGIRGAEIILPAYTCSVVAHAIVLSGNIPRFVDIRLDDYNMDLDEVEAAINERTSVVIATHLFGQPLDVDRLGAIIRRAEAQWGHKVWVVQDCAHCFGARWHGRLVCNEGDVALFGLNVSKTITSVFGGMLTGEDVDIEARVREHRDKTFCQAGVGKTARRLFYLLAVYPAFQTSLYGAVNWLSGHTRLLNRFTVAYHRDDIIRFPPDHRTAMSDLEASVGMVQLKKYDGIVARRRAHAAFYDERLRDVHGLTLPPADEGATFSHYTVRVDGRDDLVRAARQRGVELGTVIDYALPETAAYGSREGAFAASRRCTREVVNLPVHPDLTADQRAHVVSAVRQAAGAPS